MNRPRIGILLIGQTPRADLTAPLEPLGRTYDLVIQGALDGLTTNDLPDSGDGTYPLITRLRDGVQVTVDAGFLAPRLQACIDDLEQDGVIAHILLCAGPFPTLTSTRPLVRPFQLAAKTLASAGLSHLGLVVPTNDQALPAANKWAQAGFQPVVWSMETKPADLPLERWIEAHTMRHTGLAALVFDYVGYPLDTLRRVQDLIALPVIDLGHLAVAAFEAMLLKDRV